MKQSCLASFTESATNIVVGFGISLGAQMLFLPMLGVPINHIQNFVFACIMTVISLARSFILRRIFEALHIRRPLSPFVQAVVAERFRQIESEGWSAAHDDEHKTGELARAGASYALSAAKDSFRSPPGPWPWGNEWWKPQGLRRDLVKSAALIIAEGERHDRNRKRKPLVTVSAPTASTKVA